MSLGWDVGLSRALVSAITSVELKLKADWIVKASDTYFELLWLSSDDIAFKECIAVQDKGSYIFLSDGLKIVRIFITTSIR